MSDIVIYITNSQFSRVTLNKGELGIGTPYQSRESANEISVPRASIEDKLAAIVGLQQGYRTATIAQLRSGYGGGNGNDAEDRLIDRFKEKLRGILFQAGGIPSDAAGRQVIYYFTYPGGDRDGQRAVYRTIDSARDAIVAILDEWKTLFQDILNKKIGLVRDVEAEEAAKEEEKKKEQEKQEEATRQAATYARLTAVPTSNTRQVWGAITIDIVKLEIPLYQALVSASNDLLKLKTIQFFDEDREYKTIFNLGADKQYVMEAWRPVLSNSASLQVKLSTPLDNNINIYDTAYISREFANTIVDSITITRPTPVDNTLSLRPPNTSVGNFVQNKQALQNATITSLGLYTGSVGVISGSTISYDDRIFNRWFTADFNSSELNINFEDYKNYVYFGSAVQRLSAFREKLRKIEQLQTRAALSSSNLGERQRVVEQELIKRNFDNYEQFLYYDTTNAAYSASAYYADNSTEYNLTGSWPRQQNGTLYPTTSSIALDWFTSQSAIAERFDEFNPNNLVKNLPNYIQEDEESNEFLTFISLFGHMMDNIKVYIDQMPNIYSTNPDPFEELSMDQVYEVAKSFGLKLPNAYSLESLQEFISTVYDGEGARALVAQTWKRFIHSLVYLSKIKGTRTSFDALLNIYGISSPLIQIKEASYPSRDNYITSEELVYGLQTNTGSSLQYIDLDVSGKNVRTIQFRFTPTTRNSSVIFGSKGFTWDVRIAPHPSSSVMYKPLSSSGTAIYQNTKIDYGKLEVYSVTGATRILHTSSGYFPIFGNDYTHVMLRSSSNNIDLHIIQTDGDQVLYRESTNGFFSASAFAVNYSGTTRLTFGTPTLSAVKFAGVMDDIRVWEEYIEDDIFLKQAYDPGSNFGNTYSSSYDALLYDISFSVYTASISQSVKNESAYYGTFTALTSGSTVGFTTESYVRIARNIKQHVPLAGSTAYSNNKIVVAGPPVFKDSFVDDDGVYELSSKVSIKPVDEKIYTSGQPIAYFAISPTDYVNSNILRSIGVIDVNYLIGSPRKMAGERYTEVDAMLNYYLERYNKEINASEYIRFFRNALKAPFEYAKEMLPARAKLFDGIVIQSPILERKRVPTFKEINISGTNTENFFDFQSGSYTASVAYDAGAYSFEFEYDMIDEKDYSNITRPIIQLINNSYVTSSLLSSNNAYLTIESTLTNPTEFVNSTNPEDLPPQRQFLQKVGNWYVSSSLANENSAFSYLEAFLSSSINTVPTSSGYPRNPYYGIVNRIESENNTLVPYLEISPISDFNDVGTTTYFHNPTGVYPFISRTSRYEKKRYLAKFDTIGEVYSPVSELFGPITLLPSSSVVDLPGRSYITTKPREYASGSYHSGILRISKLFTLLSIQGDENLRFRLYKDESSQLTDLSRPYDTLPTEDSGVLFDGLLETDPEVFPYVMIHTPDNPGGIVYFTINNQSENTVASTLTLTYFEYEPPQQIPQGYLPRHYKFYRNNGIATKRRNYLGCRSIFCPEGCPPDVTPTDTISPIIVTVSTTTDIVVSTEPLSSIQQSLLGTLTPGGLLTQEPIRPITGVSGTGTPNPIDRIITFGGGGILNDKGSGG